MFDYSLLHYIPDFLENFGSRFPPGSREGARLLSSHFRRSLGRGTKQIFKNRYYLDISEYQRKLGSLSIVPFCCRTVWFESCLHLRFWWQFVFLKSSTLLGSFQRRSVLANFARIFPISAKLSKFRLSNLKLSNCPFQLYVSLLKCIWNHQSIRCIEQIYIWLWHS